MLRSIGAKDQLKGVVFGSSVACRHPLGLEMPKKISWSGGCQAAYALSGGVFGWQKTSDSRGNGWKSRWMELPMLVPMLIRDRPS